MEVVCGGYCHVVVVAMWCVSWCRLVVGGIAVVLVLFCGVTPWAWCVVVSILVVFSDESRRRRLSVRAGHYVCCYVYISIVGSEFQHVGCH